jgi:hypothetical protein
MFKSYRCNKGSEYIVYDDNFTGVLPVEKQVFVPFEIVDLVVSIYSIYYKLPVAPNLALALVYCADQWHLSVSTLIGMLETSYRIGPDKFGQYKDDVLKFLVLLP